jgi:hypothetical protein
MTPKRRHSFDPRRRIAFRRIAGAALERAPLIVLRWLPAGRRNGVEWVSRNPTRDDRHSGSFKVNVRTGKWGDFATGDRGADLISLAAYLFRLRKPRQPCGLPR